MSRLTVAPRRACNPVLCLATNSLNGRTIGRAFEYDVPSKSLSGAGSYGRKTNMKKTLIIAAAMVASAALGIGGYVLFTGMKQGPASQPGSKQQAGAGPATLPAGDPPMPQAKLPTDPAAAISSPAPAPLPEDPAAAQRAAREQAAQIALVNVQVLAARGEFQQAVKLCQLAVQTYRDTAAAQSFSDLLTQSLQGQLQDQADQLARQQQELAALNEEQRADRHARFAQYRDAGLAALDQRDYDSALRNLRLALTEEDDADTRQLIAETIARTAKPTLAVADFSVSGDVGLADAGQAVAQLLLTRFDPRRFVLVERTHLSDVLAERNLTMAQVVADAAAVKGQPLAGVRYLVLGSVVRMGYLTVSARVVDVATGVIVQTAEISAADPAGLQAGLADLAAMLSMSPEEKIAFLQARQQQADAATRQTLQAQIVQQQAVQVEIVRASRAFELQLVIVVRSRQHERDARAALDVAKYLLANQQYRRAAEMARQGVENFSDTKYRNDFFDCLAAAQAKLQPDDDHDRKDREEKFGKFRADGLAAVKIGDFEIAIVTFRNALLVQDDRDVRVMLDDCVKQAALPGLAVLDFAGDVGDKGDDLAAAMLGEFRTQNYRRLGRERLADILHKNKLTMAQANDRPWALAGKDTGSLKMLVTANVQKQGPGLVLDARLLDLRGGYEVQDAQVAVADRNGLKTAIAVAARILQMSRAEKQAWLDGQRFDSLMRQADDAFKAGKFADALADYRAAFAIRADRDAREGLQKSQAALDRIRQEQDDRQARHDRFARHRADGLAAAGRGDFSAAIVAFTAAIKEEPSDEVQAKLDQARRDLDKQRQDRDRQAKHDRAVKFRQDGADAMTRRDYDSAAAAFANALKEEDSAEVKTLLEQAKARQADAAQETAKYNEAIRSAKSAGSAGKWQEALDSYKQAAAIRNTPEAAEGQRTAQARLDTLAKQAEAAQAKRQRFEQLKAAGIAAADKQDYAAAITAFRTALALFDDADVEKRLADATAAEKAKKQAADQAQIDQKYNDLMTKAAAASKAEKWQDALDAYRAANQVKRTPEAQAGIDLATKKLAESAAAEKENAAYTKALAAATAAANKKDWDVAAKNIADAQAAKPDGPELKALLTKVGVLLTVTATLDGRDRPGARVTIDGAAQDDPTPATFQLTPGRSYKIQVTYAPSGRTRYTTDTTTLTPTAPGLSSYRANIRTDNSPPTQPAPTPTRPARGS